MHAFIFNIQQFSIHDGPGIRTTVFFQGCPLKCVWCHNPEGIPQYPENTDITHSTVKKYTVDELLSEVLKDKVFFDESGGGVTFSGGEPLMQSEFLIEMLHKLKKAGVHTTIDTSGYAPHDIFRQVVSLCDLVLFDLKIIDNNKHKDYTGSGNSMIHKNLNFLAGSSIPFRIRIPLVNEMTAGDENIQEIAEILKSMKNIQIDLLSYHDLGTGKSKNAAIKNKNKLSTPDEKRIEEISQLLESYDFNVHLGG